MKYIRLPREKFTLHENILLDVLTVALIEIAVDPVDRSGRDHPDQRPVRLGDPRNGYANQFPILQPCDELRDIAAPEMSQPFRIGKFLIQIQKTPAGVIAALPECLVIGGKNLISFRIQQKVGSLIFFIFDLLNDRLDQFVIAQFEPDQSFFFTSGGQQRQPAGNDSVIGRIRIRRTPQDGPSALNKIQ